MKPSRVIRGVVGLAGRGVTIFRSGGTGQFGLFVREEIIRNSLIRLRRNRQAPAAVVECPICGWSGQRFLTHVGSGYVVWNAMCPSCGSFPRHRGFAWLLKHHLSDHLSSLGSGTGYRLLFAPERGMKSLLENYIPSLEGVDYSQINELVVHREDIQALSFADGSVDFFSCFHVVEHVPDDRRALRELARVLHPQGLGILNVPITFGRPQTVEFGRPNPLLNDHYFDYGEDFTDRVVEAGFSGVGYRLSSVVPTEHFDLMALQDELIYVVRPAPEGSSELLSESQESIAERE